MDVTALLVAIAALLLGAGVLLVILNHAQKPEPEPPVSPTPSPPQPQPPEPVAPVPAPVALQPVMAEPEPSKVTAPELDVPAYRLEIESSDLGWNNAFYSVFGYEREEHADTLEWWISHIHPDDAMLVNDIMNKLIEPTVQEWEVVYRFRRGNQSFVQIKDHVTIERDPQGQATAITGVMTPLPTTASPAIT